MNHPCYRLISYETNVWAIIKFDGIVNDGGLMFKLTIKSINCYENHAARGEYLAIWALLIVYKWENIHGAAWFTNSPFISD